MSSARDTYLGLRAFVDELARCGLREACTSPGSRSTPLVLSLAAEERIRCTSHVDERCGGFFALGLAKAGGRPVALACTSGTAAANYAPAVIEAHEARVPLLVLTADRPPELRDLGAGQTIDQVKLYGAAASWYLEVDAQPATPERLRWLRQLACRAYWTALADRPGPVHLNFSLREPLTLEAPLAADEPGGGRPDGRPWVARRSAPRTPSPAAIGDLRAELERRPRALLVAGRAERDHPALGAALAALAERARIPLLADPLSGARRGPAAVAHYDALLRDPAWAAEHAPDLVIRVGDLPTSKPLRTWLHGLDDALQVAIDREAAWQDPGGAVSTVIEADPRTAVEGLMADLAPDGHAPATAIVREAGADRNAATRTIASDAGAHGDSAWLQRWRRADDAAAGAIAGVLGDAGLSEPRVAAELAARLPEDATLVVASSMPVRDVETFAPARAAPPRVLSNRGANGIDGTVSTAFGVAAAAAPAPVVLLIGDVALAHDVGGLLAASRTGARLTIVLLHNDGGGIFDFLPVSATEPRERYVDHVATPHGLDFAHAAALYGCAYERADGLGAFHAALDRALTAERTTIVAVHTDRAANVALHRDVWRAVATAIAPQSQSRRS